MASNDGDDPTSAAKRQSQAAQSQAAGRSSVKRASAYSTRDPESTAIETVAELQAAHLQQLCNVLDQRLSLLMSIMHWSDDDRASKLPSQAPHLKSEALKGANIRATLDASNIEPLTEEDMDTQEMPAFATAKASQRKAAEADRRKSITRRKSLKSKKELDREAKEAANLANAISEEVTREQIHKRERDMLHKIELEERRKTREAAEMARLATEEASKLSKAQQPRMARRQVQAASRQR